MSRQGRDLEKLVSTLEQCLGAEGAEVRSPDRIDDKVTGSKREVDVSVRMMVGSVPILAIFECRDRTAVDDVLWIEQLAQKRNDLNAAKAVAVSSSGFSVNAVKKARFLGIELRKIDELNREEIRGWFIAGDLMLYERRSHFLRVSVSLDTQLSADEILDTSVRNALSSLSVDSDIFTGKKDGRNVNLKTIWANIPPDSDIFRGVPQDGNRITRTIVLNYRNPEERYQLKTASGGVDISKLTIKAELWVESLLVPIGAIRSYSEGGRTLIEGVEYEIEIDGVKNIISINREPGTGRISVTRRVLE